ncbi:hypothetical protein [Neobacillus cucumis]|uniref:hypothetical protein n=1 Tax=Neobacillus cucumis TaxID=1740721 RepID=UPI001964F457|nr:hypothetical protein [Neobacillus cucumis]MBM7652007.1 ferric iron reductase protein FhuF [Neobacillus cucumis]
MADKLTDIERIQLQQSNLPHSFLINDLLDDTFLREFFKKFAHAIGAPNEKAAASMLSKRYAFIAVLSLYAMSKWNKQLNMSLNKGCNS